MFSLIFVGLGFEHLFSDALIQNLMPEWIPFKRAVSIAAGGWLVVWGTLILVGWQVRYAAIALGSFVLLVTIVVHLPGVLSEPNSIDQQNKWLWIVLQRSNLAKNLCLIGVCLHFLHHQVGRYSLENWLANR